MRWLPGTNGDGGELLEELLPQYVKLWERAQAVLAVLIGNDTSGKVTRRDAIDLFCDALALNYRVGPPEIFALGLITSLNEQDAYGAVVDLPTWLAHLEDEKEGKKKQQPTEPSSPGGPGG
jgi:hypothetical protein